MPSIPVDVLLLILEHVDKASLAKICRVNKICCSCPQDVLYRDVQFYGYGEDIQAYPLLARSAHLSQLIPNRPVNEVISLGFTHLGGSVDFGFFALHFSDPETCNGPIILVSETRTAPDIDFSFTHVFKDIRQLQHVHP
jgi:hypothetical protein